MNRLKKLAGLITEHHGKEVAAAGEFRVEKSGVTAYIYKGSKMLLEIPYGNLLDIAIELAESQDRDWSPDDEHSEDIEDVSGDPV